MGREFGESRRIVTPVTHNAPMATVYTVQADSKSEATTGLEQMCVALGLVPMASGRVFEVPGRGGRWMARAVPDQQRQPGLTCTLPNDAS
jgi:hypothetical protein